MPLRLAEIILVIEILDTKRGLRFAKYIKKVATAYIICRKLTLLHIAGHCIMRG